MPRVLTPPFFARALRGGVALCALAVAACEPITATALFPAPGDAPTYGKGPFPSDIFLDDAGRIGPIEDLSLVGPLEHEALQAQLSLLDGFGTRPVVELFFDAPVDAGTVPAHTAADTDALFVMNVDPASPAVGRVTPMDWRVRDGARAIAGAVPRGVVLETGTRYAAFLTTQVRGVDGRLGGSAGFDLLRSAAPEALPDNLKSTRAALDFLGRSDVVAVAAFTTAHARRGLLRARAEIQALPAPTVTFDDASVIFAGPERLRALLGVPVRDDDGEARLGWSWPSGLAHDHVAAVGTGTLHGVTFRREEKDGDAGKLPDSGTWAVDDDGAPVVDRAATFPITFAVPVGAMPASGWPVAFFGHGLGGSRAQMLAFIDTLAREGFVTVAIDADGHGSRHTDVDEHNNAGARLGDAFLGVQDMKDGFGDVEGTGTALDVFHGFVNLSAMRDQMRESVIDLSQVVRLLESDPDLSALVPGTRVDGSRIAYLGESFGGVLGALFCAEEPDVHMFYLDVPGGGVLEYAGPNSPVLSAFYKLFIPSAWGVDRPLDRFDSLIGLGAAIFDGADPLTYAPHVLRDRPRVGETPLGPRSVVLGEVVGDEVLPNSATNALARALGIPLLAPAFGALPGIPVEAGPLAGNVDGQTAALVQFAPANHGDNWSKEAGARKYAPFGEDDLDFQLLPATIPVANPVRAIHEQVRGMLAGVRDEETPVLVSTVRPRHDFDDDGVSDEDELLAGTDPLSPQ